MFEKIEIGLEIGLKDIGKKTRKKLISMEFQDCRYSNKILQQQLQHGIICATIRICVSRSSNKTSFLLAHNHDLGFQVLNR